MLGHIRAFAKSPFATVLFVLLLASFAVFGISDVFNNRIVRDAVVKAGGRTVSGAEFKQMFDSYRKQIEQQNPGQTITTEQAATAGVDRGLVDQLAASESFAEMISRLGLNPSDKLVVAEIGKTRAFFDNITGRFDRATYQERLQQAGLTEAQYERLLRDQIAQTHLISGLAAGLTVPRTYVAAIAAFNRESRSFSWFSVDPRVVGPEARPTDAQLLAYIKENAATFTKPELRTISFVRFSPAAIAGSIPVNEADVKKRFEFEKDTLSIPETRSFVQVPVKDQAQGRAAAERLRKGESPDAVAKSLGVNTVAYTDAPKTAVSDRQIADVAFAAKEGEIVGPAQGSLGMAVVKVTKINPGHQATLEEARTKIENEVRKDAATEKVYQAVQKYEDARSGGANMAEAAKAAGGEVMTFPVPVTAQGTTLQGQQTGLPPKLLASAFTLPQTGESEVLDLGEGEYAAVRVDKVQPSALASLDEVRTAATQRYVLQDMAKRVQAKADELAARVRKGEDPAKVAASVGAKAETVADGRRDLAGQAFSQDLIGKVFGAKPGEVVVGEGQRLDFVVAKVNQVKTDPLPQLAQLVEQQRDNFRGAVFNDVGFAARNAARAEVKPQVDYNRARTAIGLEAQSAAPASAPAGQKK